MIPDGNEAHPAWYRQPWMWLVVGLPLTSVVASLFMVYISVKHKDDLVRDDWYKAGRAINQDLHAESRARELGLAASLVLDPAGPAVSVSISNGKSLPERLQLLMVHSTLSGEDMTVMLQRGVDGSWRGALPRLPMGKRHLMLEPMLPENDAGRWRLRAADVIFQGEPVNLLPHG